MIYWQYFCRDPILTNERCETPIEESLMKSSLAEVECKEEENDEWWEEEEEEEEEEEGKGGEREEEEEEEKVD